MQRKMGLSLVMAVVMAAGCGGAAPRSADYEGWLTDFGAAKKAAAERKVPILANFAGSDWCGWCIRLDEEVFSTDAFKTFAKDNLVLFLADFPSHKEQAADVKEQNRKLADTYGIRGFPTILLLDAEGKELARTGYRPGGPEKYVAHLKDLMPEPETNGKPSPAGAADGS